MQQDGRGLHTGYCGDELTCTGSGAKGVLPSFGGAAARFSARSICGDSRPPCGSEAGMVHDNTPNYSQISLLY